MNDMRYMRFMMVNTLSMADMIQQRSDEVDGIVCKLRIIEV